MLIFGKISLFNMFFSIDIFPGPVKIKLINPAINNTLNSYPITNPSGICAEIIAPIMVIIRKMDAILVKIPIKIAIPPKNSTKNTGITNSGGNPILLKNPPVPAISNILGNPCAINIIPITILIGNGAKFINFC